MGYGKKLTRLKQHRKDAGMTQEDLSVDSGVDVRTISRLENGKYSTMPRTAEALAKALGLSDYGVLL